MQMLLVVGGLVARSLSGGAMHIPGISADSTIPLSQQYELQGALLTLMSALTYSCLNLLYDYTVQSTEDPPPHPVIMNQMARVGLLANGLYTAAFTLPHWDAMVGMHLKQSEHGAWGAAGLLAVFGLLYNVHGIVQVRISILLLVLCFSECCMSAVQQGCRMHLPCARSGKARQVRCACMTCSNG